MGSGMSVQEKQETPKEGTSSDQGTCREDSWKIPTPQCPESGSSLRVILKAHVPQYPGTLDPKA